MAFVILAFLRLGFGGVCFFIALWLLIPSIDVSSGPSFVLGPLSSFLSINLFKRISLLSYGLYLWHVPLLGAIFVALRDLVPHHWLPTLEAFPYFLIGLDFVSFIIIYGVSEISYLIFEAPLSRFSSMHGRRSQA